MRRLLTHQLWAGAPKSVSSLSRQSVLYCTVLTGRWVGESTYEAMNGLREEMDQSSGKAVTIGVH
jgi:hypothetical protein